MNNYISVGKILNFHGIKGEAKVGYSRRDFFVSLSDVFIKSDNKYLPFKIVNISFHKNFAIVKFEEINSINDLLPYKGAFIYVNETVIRNNLEEDEFLIDELINLEVFDDKDNKLGFVVGVSNNGANDLLSVKTNAQKVVLIPFVKAMVPYINIKERKIIINKIEGLLE